MRNGIKIRIGSLVLACLLVGSAYAQENETPWMDLMSQAIVAFLDNKQFDEAIEITQKALIKAKEEFGPETPEVAETLQLLARIHHVDGRYEEAEVFYKQALALYEKIEGPEHLSVGTVLNNLAKLYHSQGRYAEAEPLYKRTLQIHGKLYEPDHWIMKQITENLAALSQEPAEEGQIERSESRTLHVRYPEATSWVNDYAGVLTSEQKQELDRMLNEFETATTNQIFVAIMDRFPVDTTMEEYVNELFSRWKPGQKGKDNGVILAIFIDDRKLRIEVGYGLEENLTDAISAFIITNDIAPEFKKENYYQGIKNGINSMRAAIKNEYHSQSHPQGATGHTIPQDSFIYTIQ